MTDTVKVLSDDALREIEARANVATGEPWGLAPGNFITADFGIHDPSAGLIVAEVPCQGQPNDENDLKFIAHARTDIPALCATVRALRQQNQELKAIVDIGTSDDPGTALAKVHRIQDEATTALREQLAQRDQLLSDSAETEDRCRDLLAAYDQSSPEGVVPLDEVVRLVVDQLAHWQDRTRERTGEVERLQSELAQARQERDAALESLHDFTEAIARDNQRRKIR